MTANEDLQPVHNDFRLLPKVTYVDGTSGLGLLGRAFRYANDVGCDVWELAVERPSLLSCGVTDTDLRWLLKKQYAIHAIEVTLPGESARAFRMLDSLHFEDRSCFVLTDSGFEAFKKLEQLPSDRRLWHDLMRPHEFRQTPRWEPESHELFLGEKLVKQFKLPSPNQEAILMAFHEEQWPKSIDDPIPPCFEQDPKQRLRDTIKSLNRNQKQTLIRFRGDGTGERVMWELVISPSGQVGG